MFSWEFPKFSEQLFSRIAVNSRFYNRYLSQILAYSSNQFSFTKHRKLRIGSHLLKKSLRENFIFFAVKLYLTVDLIYYWTLEYIVFTLLHLRCLICELETECRLTLIETRDWLTVYNSQTHQIKAFNKLPALQFRIHILFG